MASSSWYILLAPTMGAVTPGLCSIQARAIWAGLTPRSSARRFDGGEDGEVGFRVVHRVGEVVALGAGGLAGLLGVRLPARKPRASGLQGMTPTPWSRQSGIISRSSSR